MGEIFVYILGIFWGLAFILAIYLTIRKRGAAVVRGMVVDIEATGYITSYRPKIIVRIDDQELNLKPSVSFYQLWLKSYRIGDSLSFYRIPSSNGYKYRQSSTYYMWVLYIIILPFITWISMIFE